uniref:Uncharacterized protein n=1 Tax=Bracon brevicornis TaxID=1563983 RepID=A0A6V7LXT4_9HYME
MSKMESPSGDNEATLQAEIEKLTLEKSTIENRFRKIYEKLRELKDSTTSSRASTDDQYEVALENICDIELSNPNELNPASQKPEAVAEEAASVSPTLLEKLQLDSSPLEEGAENSLSRQDIKTLLEEIRKIPAPVFEQKVEILTEQDLFRENALRRRISHRRHAKEKSYALGRGMKSTDYPNALLAPSITIPSTSIAVPTFDEVLRELGILKGNESHQDNDRLYFTDMRVITGQQLKALVVKRAQIVVAQKCAGKVDRSSQTYVTQAGKQRQQGCAN